MKHRELLEAFGTYRFIAQEDPLALRIADAIVRQDCTIVGNNDIAALELVDLHPEHLASSPESHSYTARPLVLQHPMNDPLRSEVYD